MLFFQLLDFSSVLKKPEQSGGAKQVGGTTPQNFDLQSRKVICLATNFRLGISSIDIFARSFTYLSYSFFSYLDPSLYIFYFLFHFLISIRL